jgi:hypothetical protein
MIRLASILTVVAAFSLIPSSFLAQKSNELDAIYSEYVKAKETPSPESLVSLDGRLREYVRERHAPYDTMRSEIDAPLPLLDDASLHKREYEEMGLTIGHFSEWFEYTGKLLDEAHKLNPNSNLRPYTLYSEVVTARDNAQQEIDIANKYLREFPNGPFAARTNERLANYYKDLYVVLRDSTIPWQYCLEFYRPLMDSRSKLDQMESSRKQAIAFCSQALALSPNDWRIRRLLQELRDGSIDGITNCSEC